MKLAVVLVEPEGAVNLGFIARLCMNFSVDELVLVNPKADLEEALIYAAKAKEYLRSSRITSDLEEALSGYELVVATTGKGYSEGDYLRQAIPLHSFLEILSSRSVGSLALVFGRESTGLTRDELSKADYLVTIPASPRYPILNLSNAVAIILYELYVLRGIASENIPPRAPREQIELLTELLGEIIGKLGIHEDKALRLKHVFETVIKRAMPSEYEARQIIYVLRRVLRKIG